MLLNAKRLLVLMLLAVMAVTVACGDDSGDDGDNGGSTTTAATATTGGGTATEAAEPTEAEDDNGDDEGEGDAAAGEQVANANCRTCHSIDGSQLVGPSWKGLYGHEVELESGEKVTADDTYIRNSIIAPNDQVVKGFPAAMPTFQGVLTDQQITDLIAYIRTLQ